MADFDRRSFLAAAAALAVAGCAVPMQAGAAGSFRSDRISVRAVGQGPDVVLIPGLISSPEVFQDLVRDVPGHRYHLVQVAGFAGAPAGGNAAEDPILPALAGEIGRYIDEAGIRPALIGHSMGGSLAMMVAARYPALVSKLMVVDMVPFLGVFFGPFGSTPASIKPSADIVMAESLKRTPDERRNYIETAIAGMVEDEDKRPIAVRHGVESDQVMSARAMHELMLTDLAPELANIRVPMTVLYVRGPNIPLTDAQMDALYKTSFAGVPQAKLIRIDDSYHYIMYDQPERFAEEARTFLAE